MGLVSSEIQYYWLFVDSPKISSNASQLTILIINHYVGSCWFLLLYFNSHLWVMFPQNFPQTVLSGEPEYDSSCQEGS